MNLPVNSVSQHENTPTSELVKQVLADARELITLEVRLAVDDVRSELLKAKRAAIVGGITALMAVLCVQTLLVALVLALGGTPGDALIVAAVLLALTAAGAWYAYASLPKRPLEKTRGRLKDDVDRLKEHVA